MPIRRAIVSQSIHLSTSSSSGLCREGGSRWGGGQGGGGGQRGGGQGGESRWGCGGMGGRGCQGSGGSLTIFSMARHAMPKEAPSKAALVLCITSNMMRAYTMKSRNIAIIT